MITIASDAVWTLRREGERRALGSSLRVADALEGLAESAQLDAAAVQAAADDVRRDVANRRSQLDALDSSEAGGIAWRALRAKARESKQWRTRHTALLQGALLRPLIAVRDHASATDRYLAELGRLCGTAWTGVALPGVDDEHERHHGSVRFALAMADVWQLPVMAHEFGHVVEGAHRETGLDGVEQSLDLQARVWEWSAEHRLPVSVVREYLSDVFAVYVAGPAYASALVLLRLDPSADPRIDPGGTHPSDRRRAALILDALAQLDESPPGPFTAIALALGATWDEMVLSAGGRTDDDAVSRDLGLLNAMWSALSAMRLALFTVTRLNRASTLEHDLASADMSGRTAIGDLLNAAWMRRLQLLSNGQESDDELGDILLELVARAVPSVAVRH